MNLQNIDSIKSVRTTLEDTEILHSLLGVPDLAHRFGPRVILVKLIKVH